MVQLTDSTEIVAPPSLSAKTGTIVALGLAVTILEGYDIQAMGVAAPRLIPALGLDHGQTAWVFSASMIGLVIGALTGGWLADRIGRKPILIASVLAFGLFSFATIFATDYYSLFLLRIATGLGLGGAVPNLITVANQAAAKGRRTLTTSMMFAGMPLGGTGASLVAQYALAHLDWRIIFAIGGLLPLLVAPVIFFKLPEMRVPDRRSMPDRPSIFSTLLGPGQAPATLLLWGGLVLHLSVLYILLNWLPLLATAKGVNPADAGLSSVLYNLGSIPGTLILGWATDRYGLRPVMALNYTLGAIVMLGLAASSGYAAIVTLSGLGGFFVVGSTYVLYGVSPIFYPLAMRGTGSGAAVAVGRLGSIAGPLIAGYLLAAGCSAGQVVMVLAPTMAIAGAAIVALSFVRRTDQL